MDVGHGEVLTIMHGGLQNGSQGPTGPFHQLGRAWESTQTQLYLRQTNKQWVHAIHTVHGTPITAATSPSLTLGRWWTATTV